MQLGNGSLVQSQTLSVKMCNYTAIVQIPQGNEQITDGKVHPKNLLGGFIGFVSKRKIGRLIGRDQGIYEKKKD